MTDRAWDKLIQALPIVLAGPILRHVTAESVTVWVALKQPAEVELTIYETANQGTALGTSILQGRSPTVALGKFLHVVAVTAKSNGNNLNSDRLYAYDLRFSFDDPQQSPKTLQQALRSLDFPRVSISYFAHQKPTFVLPPHRLEDLRIVQGSCRKPHGSGYDALPILDSLIEDRAAQPQHRPHQLFLTGDQIYGDDVAEPFLWVASPLGDALLGWEEKLPVGWREPDDVEYYTPQQLPFGRRAEVATTHAGFTAGLRNKRGKVNSHLLSLGEYYACYLLAWSPTCWLMQIPPGKQISDRHQISRRWDREARALRQFIHTLWKVRRALANIPTYTIFDDHDVSDDWNLNRAWCLRVLGRPLGRRTVQNALLAYAMFQAWGNTPEQFTTGQAGAELLTAAADWSSSSGTDTVAYDRIARYVGMPLIEAQTNLPTFIEDGTVLILKRHPEAIAWHYTVQSHCHETIVLDTRTWRGYPIDEKSSAPPMLLCPTAFEQQLRLPLQQSASATQIQLTFAIAPTNVFHLQAIDWIHHWQLRRNKVFATDVGDAWNINLEALAQLLIVLFEQRRQVVVLSGDIHYSSMVRLTRKSNLGESNSVLTQLTCSALKNEETLTRIVHTRLKDWLLPERVRHWKGWSNPPNMVELSAPQSRRDPDSHPSHPPDWNCTLEWIPRHNARTPSFGNDVTWLISPRKQANSSKRHWLQFLCFWQSPLLQEGREAIGRNNLALVQFQLAETTHSYTAIQDIYWFSTWQPTQIVYSRFKSHLADRPSLPNKA